MRVLVIHTFYKLQGGEDHVVANEIALLRSGGAEVELLSFSNDGNTLFKLLQIGFNYQSYQQTRHKLKSFQPDVVHIHNLHFSGSAAVIYAIKQADIPLVMTLHNYRLLCPSGSLYFHNQLFLSSVYSAFPWKAVKKGVYQQSKLITFWVALSAFFHEQLATWNAIDRVILLGEHSKALFSNSKLGYLSPRMVVKPNFCYPAPQNRNSTASIHHHTIDTLQNKPDKASITQENKAGAPRHFLYVGRLTEEKGVKVLLDAFADTEMPLKIAGTGPLQELVVRYASQYPNIEYLGQQSKEQISDLLDCTAALLFPSLWYETFGMVVIEAFAMGVPVIASDLGNMKAMVTDAYNGLTFEVGNSLELRKKAAEYWGLGPAERKVYGANALATYLEHYTPATNLVHLNKIYRDAISKHSCHP